MNNLLANTRLGLSLAEVVVASVLVGTVVVGALNMLGAAVQTKRARADLMVGAWLADQLLAEIKAQEYLEPDDPGLGLIGRNGGESSSDRSNWDDVDDYAFYNVSPPQTKDNTVLNEYSDWTRIVDIWWARRVNGELALLDFGLKGIRVQAIYHEGQADEKIVTRYAYRSKWGALEQAPVYDETVVTHIESELNLGGGAQTSSAHLLNHVVDPNN